MIADSNIAIADVILAHMDGGQGIIAKFFPLTEVNAVVTGFEGKRPSSGNTCER